MGTRIYKPKYLLYTTSFKTLKDNDVKDLILLVSSKELALKGCCCKMI